MKPLFVLTLLLCMLNVVAQNNLTQLGTFPVPVAAGRIFMDHQQKIWITANKSTSTTFFNVLSYYQNGQFKTFELKNSNNDYFKANRFAFSNNGIAYVMYGGVLEIYKDSLIERVVLDSSVSNLVPSNYSALTGNDDRCYFSKGRNLYKYQNHQLELYYHAEDSCGACLNINSLAVSGNNTVYAYTSAGTIILSDNDTTFISSSNYAAKLTTNVIPRYSFYTGNSLVAFENGLFFNGTSIIKTPQDFTLFGTLSLLNGNNYFFKQRTSNHDGYGLIKANNQCVSIYSQDVKQNNNLFSRLDITYNIQTDEYYVFGLVEGTNNFTLYKFNYNPASQSFFPLTNASRAYLDINTVKAGVTNNGGNFFDGIDPMFEWPKNSGKTTLYAQSLWIGGLNEQSKLHLTAQTYRQNGDVFIPTNRNDDGSLNYTDFTKNNRVWNVYKWQVEQFKNEFLQGHVTSGSYTIPETILNWPAHRNGSSNVLAEYVDYNNDGTYNALDGDYPLMYGDQMIFSIYSDGVVMDSALNHPLGIEVHQLVYAYSCPLADSSTSIINHTLFTKYTLLNKSNTNYHNMSLGLWNDFDIGLYTNDKVGCIKELNTTFSYNGTNIDNASNGYQNYLPISNHTILNGPDAPANDGIDNDNDGITDEAGEKVLQTGFLYYRNDFSAYGNPQTASDYYNFLNNKYINGQCTYAQAIFPVPDSTCTNFPYEGDPSDTSNNHSLAVPADVRTISSSQGFTFNKGDKIEIECALVQHLDSSLTYGTPEYYAANFRAIKKVINWYHAHTMPSCLDYRSNITLADPLQTHLVAYPNPTQSSLTISSDNALGTISVTDLVGREVLRLNTNSVTANLELSTLLNGLYLLRLQTGATIKIIKQ